MIGGSKNVKPEMVLKVIVDASLIIIIPGYSNCLTKCQMVKICELKGCRGRCVDKIIRQKWTLKLKFAPCNVTFGT